MKKVKAMFWIEVILHLLICVASIRSTIYHGSPAFIRKIPDAIYLLIPVLFVFFTILIIGAVILRIIMSAIFLKTSQRRLRNQREISILHLIIINIISLIPLPLLLITEMPYVSLYTIAILIVYICQVVVCCIIKKKNT